MAIFSSIATAIAGALFGGSLLAANIIGAGLAFGAKLALSKLNKPKKQRFTAVQGEVQLGGDVPVSSLYGTGKTKGHRVYYSKWGSGNRLNTDIFVLANGWCGGLEPYVYFYGQKFNLVEQPKIANEAAHYAIEGFGGYCSIRFYDGRPGQPADLHTVNNTAGLGNPWKATSRLSGLCYVIVDRVYKDHLFGKGRPDFEWVLRGLREYDPTKDSTVAGGNGPQRLADPATWVHTKNPAIHRLNYQLGVRGLRNGRTLIGEGKSLGQLDLASYFVAINYCRTLRKGKPIYECSLFVDGETDHTEALSAFDDAMAGYALNRRGLSGVVVGAPQIPVLTLTEADIPTDRPKPRQPRKSAFELYNHLSGQFTSPEAMWNPESLKPIVVNADVAADKRARQTSIDFLQVSDPDIAQYLLNVRYRQNRKGGTKTQPVSRRVGLKLQEGEWLQVDGKDWMISEWRCEQDLRITLVLSETGADIYDDGNIAPGPIVIPPTPPINPSLLFTVQDFDVHAGMIAGGNGFDVPALEFVWTPPNDPTITSVIFNYRIDGTLEDFTDQSAEPELGRYRTTKNILSEKAYVARATITTTPDRLRNFTPWRTTSTVTGALTLQVGLGQVRDDVRDRFEELQQEMNDVWRRVEEALTAFSLEGAVGEIKRQELRAEIGGSLAQIVEERRVRATQDEALAQQYTGLSATVATNQARLFAEETARANGDSALASSITGVSADLNGRFANGLVKFEAAADQSGVNARFSVMLRATLGAQFKDSGFYIELYTEAGVLKSRFAVKADQFVVWNGGNNAFLPIVIENGELKLNIANIGLVRSGRLLAQNGKMDINLNNGTIEIYS